MSLNDSALSSKDDDVVIKVENVSKKFSRSLKRSMIYGMKDITRNICGMSSNPDRLRKDEFWAVNDVSFEVKKGECLGIIGPNGSGKTTLLSLLNGIYMPDKGMVTIKGKVGALIALGAGFHSMLTGRENIYINGAILGMSKDELDENFDAIIDFADIGDFLDMPVKNYSSGMYVRVGFSVAVHCQPEILLIDEVLSVGDMSFQNKSLQRLAEIREKANAVIFVSHNTEHIRTLCDKVMVIDKGRTIFMGETYDAVQKYEEMTRDKRLQDAKRFAGLNRDDYLSDYVVFLEGGIMDASGEKIDAISIEDDVIPFLRFRVTDPIKRGKISISVLDAKSIATRPVNCIWQYSNDKDPKKFFKFDKGEYIVKVRFKNPKLAPGVYLIGFSIRDQKSGAIYARNLGHMPTFKVTGKAFERGLIYVDSEWDMRKIGESE